MTTTITTEQDALYYEHRWLNRNKGNVEQCFINRQVCEAFLRALADEDEECADVLRKFDAGIIKVRSPYVVYDEEEEVEEEHDYEEDELSWNEILYWDDRY